MSIVKDVVEFKGAVDIVDVDLSTGMGGPSVTTMVRFDSEVPMLFAASTMIS